MPLYLREAEVAELLTPADALAAVAEAIEILKNGQARAFQDETTIIGDVILAAAAAVSTTTKTRPKKKKKKTTA